jgi:thymidylate synthase (FAD)
MSRTPVLDNGYVLFVDSMGTEESIIEAARQSTSGGFVSWEPYEGHPKGDAGLLSYLYREGHSTPFEMCELLIEVQAPILVVREWMRHRTLSYNEMSARYVQMPNLHYVPPVERMVEQGRHNKQGSDDKRLPDVVCEDLRSLFEHEQQGIYSNYEAALATGLTREVARVNTPVSRYTRMRVKGNLRNWLNFLRQRMAPNAQQEIRAYAEVIGGIVKERWPRTWDLFEEWDLYGKKLSRTEYAEYLAWKSSPNSRKNTL